MKKFLLMALLVSVFISCSNRNLKEYLDQGFVTPKFENDVYFTNYSEGEGRKIYVPSEEDIEVHFSITNKYNKELRATLAFPESDAELFEKIPKITTTNSTGLIISFKFKKIAEPKDSNAFLGMSVPIEIKLFDAKHGRYLSSRLINANCNTAPLPIDENAISYNLEKDEYTIHLPKNEGKHNDLKEVRFEVSTKQGNGEIQYKVVSIEKAEEQDKDYVLKVKGLLEQASGERKLKVTVLDKAGISSKTGNKNGELIFANITLLPPTKQIKLKESINPGIPVPEIKELKEYFKETKDWEDELYKVEYTMPEGAGFVYDAELNKIKNTLAINGEHKVKVTLKNPSGSTAEATYVVNIISEESADIDKEKLEIIDITNYENKIGKALSLDNYTIDFIENSGEYVGNLNIPYTGYKTELKIKVISFDINAHVQDIVESGLVGTNQKEFTTLLSKTTNSTTSIKFKIVSQYGNTTKNYKINFKREKFVRISLKLSAEIVSGYNGGGKISCEWDYGRQEHTDTTVATYIKVAKNAKLKFNIEANEGSKIGSIVSTVVAHAINGAGKKKIEFNLEANDNFEITVQFSPEIIVKWVDYKAIGLSEGYNSGNMSYKKDGISKSQTPSIQPNPFVVPKGCDVTFTIIELYSDYQVKGWKVNNKIINKSKDSYELSNDKCSLTIKNIEKDVIVSVLTEIKKVKLIWNVEGGMGASIEAKEGVQTLTSPCYIQKGRNVTFVPKTAKGYKIKGWKVNENEYLNSVNEAGIKIGVTWILTLSNINEDKTIILLLEKQKHKLTVNIEGSMPGIKLKLSKQDGIPISPDEVNNHQVYQNIEHGSSITFEAIITDTNYEIEGWKCKKADGTITDTALHSGQTENIKFLTMNESYSVTLKIKRKD